MFEPSSSCQAAVTDLVHRGLRRSQLGALLGGAHLGGAFAAGPRHPPEAGKAKGSESEFPYAPKKEKGEPLVLCQV